MARDFLRDFGVELGNVNKRQNKYKCGGLSTALRSGRDDDFRGGSMQERVGESGQAPHFVHGLGLFSATAIVMGSMIGSGIFIVPADISRKWGRRRC